MDHIPAMGDIWIIDQVLNFLFYTRSCIVYIYYYNIPKFLQQYDGKLSFKLFVTNYSFTCSPTLNKCSVFLSEQNHKLYQNYDQLFKVKREY